MIHAFTRSYRYGQEGLGDYYGSYATEGDAYRALEQDEHSSWFTLMTDSDEIKPGHLVRVARGTMPILHGGDGWLWTHIYEGSHGKFTRVADAHGGRQ